MLAAPVSFRLRCHALASAAFYTLSSPLTTALENFHVVFDVVLPCFFNHGIDTLFLQRFLGQCQI